MTSAATTRRSVTVRAPAKVNLELRVGPRRADGFHEVATVYMAVGLHDVVTVVPADELSMSSVPPISKDTDNATTRAMMAQKKIISARNLPNTISLMETGAEIRKVRVTVRKLP